MSFRVPVRDSDKEGSSQLSRSGGKIVLALAGHFNHLLGRITLKREQNQSNPLISVRSQLPPITRRG